MQDYLAETSETRVTNFFVVADIRPLSTPIRFFLGGWGDLLRKLTGDAWVMAAFSKLGFIGKLFDSNRPGVQYHIAVVNLSRSAGRIHLISRLPKLAEFLFIYHAEVGVGCEKLDDS